MRKPRHAIAPSVRIAAAVAGLLVALVSVTLSQQIAGASSAPPPTTAHDSAYQAAARLTGPVTTGHIVEPLSAQPLDLAANGYVEQEYFASGTATAFKAAASPSDGQWSIAPTTSAPYKTRIVVRRPANPAKFNGTVIVEWLNVSVVESPPEWNFLNPMLMRDGYAWVGVSAQAFGVQGGNPILGSPGSLAGSGGLVAAEPARYGTLHHPGDKYALDIFAQIGRALRVPHPAALGGLHPKDIVAAGESQSAFYLTPFAAAVQPRTGTFDGIFIHSRAGAGARLSASTPRNLRIRTDLKVPVFMFETQTDMTLLGYAAAQQPNTDRIRTWEVAGTAHADAYLLGAGAGVLGCTTPVNDGPQHTVVQAAFTAFDRWVVHGTPPPSPPPFRLSSTHRVTLALDRHGNVIGGVRTPAVDVPVSTLSGAPPKGAGEICSLFGSTMPFSSSELVSLYGTKSHYLSLYKASLNKAIAKGFILGADRAALLAQAEQVQLPA